MFRRWRKIAEERFPEVVWEHSHVVVADDGHAKTFCVYTAPDVAAMEEHVSMLGGYEIEAIHEIAGDVTPADFPPA